MEELRAVHQFGAAVFQGSIGSPWNTCGDSAMHDEACHRYAGTRATPSVVATSGVPPDISTDRAATPTRHGLVDNEVSVISAVGAAVGVSLSSAHGDHGLSTSVRGETRMSDAVNALFASMMPNARLSTRAGRGAIPHDLPVRATTSLPSLSTEIACARTPPSQTAATSPRVPSVSAVPLSVMMAPPSQRPVVGSAEVSVPSGCHCSRHTALVACCLREPPFGMRSGSCVGRPP